MARGTRNTAGQVRPVRIRRRVGAPDRAGAGHRCASVSRWRCRCAGDSHTAVFTELLEQWLADKEPTPAEVHHLLQGERPQ